MKGSLLALALSLVMFAACGTPSVENVAEFIGNPYLPLWEHVPDGEPHVFEDPDCPGQYRVYVYGSHDTRFESFCGQDVRCWSAPVEDLTAWRDEGPVFMYQAPDGLWDGMWAPDVAEVNRRDDGSRKYYLYPHDRGEGRIGMVCVSDRPDGPFTPVNVSEDGYHLLDGSVIEFDPGVFVEPVDDPEDPDYATGFRAYVAWGIIRSSGTELDPNTMYSPRNGKPDFPYWLPSMVTAPMVGQEGITFQGLDLTDRIEFPEIAEGEDLADFNFFEASSFRKVGNKYLYIYSGHAGPEYGLPMANPTLKYAYADSPRGPWKSGGILVDARGPILSRDGSTIECSFSGSNTHGSLEYMNGQWYVFYHRAPRGFAYARQGMVAPVTVRCEEKPVSEGGKVEILPFDPYKGVQTVKAADGHEYKGAEVTSEGFYMYGLPPYRYYSAGYACILSNPMSMQDSWDVWDNRMDVTGVATGDYLGFKYFGFGGLATAKNGIPAFEGTQPGNGTVFNLFLATRTPEAFKIAVWIDGPWADGAWKGTKAAEIDIPAGSTSDVARYSVELGDAVDKLDQKHALFLVAEGPDGEPLCDIMGLGFSKKGEVMDFPVPPSVRFSVDGKPVDTPVTPEWATDANGYADDTNYLVHVPEGITIRNIEAFASSPEVAIDIDQSSRLARCTYKGLTKTYRFER